MNKTKARILYPTPEEDAEIAQQIAENPDEAEWTAEDSANAISIDEISPEFAKWSRQRAEDLKTGRIERVTLTLDRETIAWFKHQTGEEGATGGTRWMHLAEKTLQEHAQRESVPERTPEEELPQAQGKQDTCPQADPPTPATVPEQSVTAGT